MSELVVVYVSGAPNKGADSYYSFSERSIVMYGKNPVSLLICLKGALFKIKLIPALSVISSFLAPNKAADSYYGFSERSMELYGKTQFLF